MCRLLAYLGQPIFIHTLLYKPMNSLVKQSIHALESTIHVNGDGFGLSWYRADQTDPALYKADTPAWNDPNLQHLANKISTHCLLAHVRAASHGHVMLPNCHPFSWKNLSMMHNGTIHGFQFIKRTLQNALSDETFHWIEGNTDTEHFYALFIDQLNTQPPPHTTQHIADSLIRTIKQVQEWLSQKAPSNYMTLNLVVSDGYRMVAIRYISSDEQPAKSLHYAYGRSCEHSDGQLHIHPLDNSQNHMMLVSSEKLSNKQEDWQKVPRNHALTYEPGYPPSFISIPE